MALTYRIIGRRALGPQTEAVDVQWVDDSGAILRRDLMTEAAAMRKRAAELEHEAKFVPDQVNAPIGTPDAEIFRQLEMKRDHLIEHLGQQ